MKNKIFGLALIALIIALYAAGAAARVTVENGCYVVNDAEGAAAVAGNKKATRDEARARACADALVKILDSRAPGVSDKDEYEATREKLISRSASLIKSFKISSESVNKEGMMNVKGVCRVGETALDNIIGPDVIKMLGNPRIMILIDELVGDKAPFISTVEAEVMRIFEKAGYLIVDPGQAKALIKLGAAQAFNDPALLTEAARTLRADIIIVGRAIAGAYAKQKLHGVNLYGVTGSVQLKAVLTQTAYQIASKTISSSTGRKPAGSLGGGADRTFKSAAAQAAGEILYKIAYSMASAGSALDGLTVNIRIADLNFNDVEVIESKLKAVDGANLFERSYANNLLELDLVSSKNARAVASLLAEQGVNIDAVTNQTVSGKFVRRSGAVIQSNKAAIQVKISGVNSFADSSVIEDALKKFIGSAGDTASNYHDNMLEILINADGKTARDIAEFLGNNGVNIDSVAEDIVAGSAVQERGKSGGLW